jgi:hypothetical protein
MAGRLAAQVPLRHSPELSIERRNEPIERPLLAFAPCREKRLDARKTSLHGNSPFPVAF